MVSKPDFTRYTSLVDEEDLALGLADQLRELAHFFKRIPEADSQVLHSPYQWTFRQVLQHMNDCERVFAYRLLCFSRGDTTRLPGFDEQEYASAADANRLELGVHLAEFEAIRHSTLHLIRHLPIDAWQRNGIANDTELSVQDLVRIILGHARHHGNILHQRARIAGLHV